MRGTTPTKRIVAAASATERLGRIKAPYEKKMKQIRAKMQSKGLYGCETCPVNEGVMRTWRLKTAGALTYVASRRALGLTFAAASHGKDTDPYIRRVIAFRRAFDVQNESTVIIRKILKSCRQIKSYLVFMLEVSKVFNLCELCVVKLVEVIWHPTFSSFFFNSGSQQSSFHWV